jgi:hypothetical protein
MGRGTQPRYLKVRVSVLLAIAAVIAAGIVVAGCVHVVHGSKVHTWLGLQVCRKGRWTLDHTFMNLTDYIGQSRLVAALDDGVVVALIRCGVVRIHPTASELASELEATGQIESQ